LYQLVEACGCAVHKCEKKLQLCVDKNEPIMCWNATYRLRINPQSEPNRAFIDNQYAPIWLVLV